MRQIKFSRKKMKLLLDEQFMLNFFNEKINKFNRGTKEIKRLSIHPIKNHSSRSFTHIVCFYKLYFKNRKKPFNIIGSAHSDGSRLKLFQRQKYIYNHGFDSGDYKVPQPLFYYEPLRAMFYEAAESHNLYSFIRKKDFNTVNWAMSKVAKWLAKFHRLQMKKSDYLKNQLSMKAVDPADILGGKSVLVKKYKKDLLQLFKQIKKIEKEILREPRKQSAVVHGDLHPENIIINKKGAIKNFAVIDFTEMRIAPPMYDVSSFMQQVESMSKGYFSLDKIAKLQKKFLEEYLKASGKKMDKSLENQLHLYVAWVSLRGAIYFIGAKKEKKIEELIGEMEEHLEKIKV